MVVCEHSVFDLHCRFVARARFGRTRFTAFTPSNAVYALKLPYRSWVGHFRTAVARALPVSMSSLGDQVSPLRQCRFNFPVPHHKPTPQ